MSLFIFVFFITSHNFVLRSAQSYHPPSRRKESSPTVMGHVWAGQILYDTAILLPRCPGPATGL
jgi:hypothetical protein